jgi:hypothetical protein
MRRRWILEQRLVWYLGKFFLRAFISDGSAFYTLMISGYKRDLNISIDYLEHLLRFLKQI